MDTLCERERAGKRKLDWVVRVFECKAEVLDKTKAAAVLRDRLADVGVQVVVIVGLGGVWDLDAGDPRQKVVDVVVAAQLTVRDDVHPGPLLVLERCLNSDFVDLL